MNHYYDSPKIKVCDRGCGLTIEYRGKMEEKKGSTGYFERGTTQEHTYNRCDRLIKINSEKAKHGTLFPL